MATVDVSELVTEFGDFYINQGQNMNDLMQKLRQKAVTPAQFVPVVTENSVYRRSQSRLGSIVQSFQKAFTEKGALEFLPRSIDLYHMKIDLALYPDDVVESWIGFFEDLNENDRSKWPLIRYIIEKEVIPQMMQDLEKKEYYKGVYAAPTPGTAGVTGNSMNGIRKWFKNGLTAWGGDGSINDLNAGSISASNIFAKIEEIVDKLDHVLEGEELTLGMSPFWVRQYLRDKRNEHGTDVNYDSGKLTVDFYDNCRIVGFPSMSGTDDIFVTPSFNMKYVRRTNGFKTPQIETQKREVFLMTDWYEGIGFDLNELIFAHVPQGSGTGDNSISIYAD
jgi:uncharacterized protein YciU (UPF0263 family)